MVFLNKKSCFWRIALILILLFIYKPIFADEVPIFEYTGSYEYYTEGYYLIQLENFGYEVSAEVSVTYTYNCENGPDTKTSTTNVQHAELGTIWVTLPLLPPDVPEICYGGPVFNGVAVNIISATMIPQQVPNTPPTATIIGADPPEGEIPLTVAFAGSWEDDAGLGQWEWIFGDGTNFIDANEVIVAQHTYAEAGSYLVFLKVWDEQGAVGYDFIMIKAFINKPAITGNIEVNGFTHSNIELQFDASSLFEGQESIVQDYKWYFGDGAMSSGALVYHTYQGAGDYTISLDLIYMDGDSRTISKDIQIMPNASPLPSFQVYGKPIVGRSLTFDASATTDPEDEDLSYTWDFGDGKTGSGVEVSHVFSVTGTSTVMLNVSDGTNTSSLSKEIALSANQVPNAMFTFTGDLKKGNEISFDASQSYDGDGDELDYSWDFGDGKTGHGMLAVHIYDETGTYTVTLEVDDKQDVSSHFESLSIGEDGMEAYIFLVPVFVIGIGLVLYFTKFGKDRSFEGFNLVKKGY